MKTRLALAPLCALLLAPLFIAASCSVQSTQDRLDSTIIAVTDACDAAIAWADRNPEYVAAHANIAAEVAKIRKELDGVPDPTETLTKLHLIRDGFLAKKATAADVETVIGQSRILLETARTLIKVSP